MDKYKLIPLDPGEIDHVLYLLKQDCDPGTIRVDPEGTRYRRRLVERLQSDLESLVSDQVGSSWRQPQDKSDWAHLASDSHFSDFVRACAGMWCSLWWLDSNAQSQARNPPEGDDPPVPDWRDDWNRLRAHMMEVALGLTFVELVDQAKKLQHEIDHAAALEAVANKARKLIDRQGVKLKSPKTEFYLKLIREFPNKGNKAIAHYIWDHAPAKDDGESHFYFADKALIERKTRKPIDLENMVGQIAAARSNHSGSDPES